MSCFSGIDDYTDIMEKMRTTFVVGTVVYPSRTSEINTRLLIESIRTFGGLFSGIPIWCLVPRIKSKVSSQFRDLCDAANCHVRLFETPPGALRFPFAADVAGAAHAEEKARNTFDLLVWLGVNTIVFQEPRRFMLSNQACIGYRPVHHRNIGSRIDEALDPFWSSVYRICKVPSDRVFPMKTHVDGKTLRPYFNASSIVIRPKRGLFASWRDVFFAAYQQQEFEKFYKQDEMYAIFMHQAILSGIILAMFRSDEMIELPPTYNYPLHLWNHDVTESRPRRLSDLTTARHEGFYSDPNWRENIPEGDDLKNWLENRIHYL
jgi:hypothetical protein